MLEYGVRVVGDDHVETMPDLPTALTVAEEAGGDRAVVFRPVAEWAVAVSADMFDVDGPKLLFPTVKP